MKFDAAQFYASPPKQRSPKNPNSIEKPQEVATTTTILKGNHQRPPPITRQPIAYLFLQSERQYYPTPQSSSSTYPPKHPLKKKISPTMNTRTQTHHLESKTKPQPTQECYGGKRKKERQEQREKQKRGIHTQPSRPGCNDRIGVYPQRNPLFLSLFHYHSLSSHHASPSPPTPPHTHTTITPTPEEQEATSPGRDAHGNLPPT
ncbi:hypothetical protein GGS21DRAFT_518694 [Xylaria nigripes]|nr:hypothetical protein GGS21DRAFT_518694 [Xylaria nigripes]